MLIVLLDIIFRAGLIKNISENDDVKRKILKVQSTRDIINEGLNMEDKIRVNNDEVININMNNQKEKIQSSPTSKFLRKRDQTTTSKNELTIKNKKKAIIKSSTISKPKTAIPTRSSERTSSISPVPTATLSNTSVKPDLCPINCGEPECYCNFNPQTPYCFVNASGFTCDTTLTEEWRIDLNTGLTFNNEILKDLFEVCNTFIPPTNETDRKTLIKLLAISNFGYKNNVNGIWTNPFDFLGDCREKFYCDTGSNSQKNQGICKIKFNSGEACLSANQCNTQRCVNQSDINSSVIIKKVVEGTNVTSDFVCARLTDDTTLPIELNDKSKNLSKLTIIIISVGIRKKQRQQLSFFRTFLKRLKFPISNNPNKAKFNRNIKASNSRFVAKHLSPLRENFEDNLNNTRFTIRPHSTDSGKMKFSVVPDSLRNDEENNSDRISILLPTPPSLHIRDSFNSRSKRFTYDLYSTDYTNDNIPQQLFSLRKPGIIENEEYQMSESEMEGYEREEELKIIRLHEEQLKELEKLSNRLKGFS
ncbi:11175_t:CDS:2 [Diversispora eburnea]|uniref:11175_t:CDS:1 n=1 Tax=Diversispora eburnea TaxID=1213867 RepID=A0A9N9BI66_9GLOM|nr:11175_t:CDS:2 [Diversispora eburnea]